MREGLSLRLLSIFLMTAMSAAVFGASAEASIGQIMVWRSFVALIPITAYMLWRSEFPNALRTRHPGKHLLRASLGALSMALSFISLAYLDVASAQALAFLAPVFTLPLAAHLLGERFGLATVLTVLIGLAGAFAMLWERLLVPQSLAWIGLLAGLGYAVTMAFVRVHIKSMMLTETAASVAFYFALVSGIAGLCTWPFGWPDFSTQTLGLLVLTGILGGAGHIASAEALARAPVSRVVAVDYTGLIWAAGFDVLLFQIWPTHLSLFGIALILGAATLSFRR